VPKLEARLVPGDVFGSNLGESVLHPDENADHGRMCRPARPADHNVVHPAHLSATGVDDRAADQVGEGEQVALYGMTDGELVSKLRREARPPRGRASGFRVLHDAPLSSHSCWAVSELARPAGPQRPDYVGGTGRVRAGSGDVGTSGEPRDARCDGRAGGLRVSGRCGQ
jgi:hypothetical protein